MTDISYTLKATVRRNAPDLTPSKGMAAALMLITATKSVTARTANDTMKMMRVPTSARIAGLSHVAWDDIASTGSPTIDIGFAPVNSNFTADPDALNDGLDVATAAGTAKLIKDHANYGKRVWELLGLTEDPGGEADIYVSFVDAATNVTGDVTVEVAFTEN